MLKLTNIKIIFNLFYNFILHTLRQYIDPYYNLMAHNYII